MRFANRTGPLRRDHRRSAFTFAELLVVIGLIAVLVAILLPAIAAARRQANLVKCASNLHQIASACLLHAHDKNGYLPLSGNVETNYSFGSGFGFAGEEGTGIEAITLALNDPYRRRYTYGGGNRAVFFLVPVPAALAKYFGIEGLPFDDVYKLDLALNDNRGAWKMFMCPETDALTKSRASPDPADTTPQGQGTMMAVSARGDYVYAWSTNTDYAFNEGLMGFHWDPQYRTRRLSGKLTAARRSSEMVLLTDARRRSSPAFSWARDPWICWTPALNTTGAVTLADVWADNARAADRSSFDVPRHRGRMSVAFADGHVELLRLESRDLVRAYLLTD